MPVSSWTPPFEYVPSLEFWNNNPYGEDANVSVVTDENLVIITANDSSFQSKISLDNHSMSFARSNLDDWKDNLRPIRRYVQYDTINNGIWIPISKIDIFKDTLSSSICVKRIEIERFSNILLPGMDKSQVLTRERLNNKGLGYDILIYPNPASNILNLFLDRNSSSDGTEFTIRIINIKGVILREFKRSAGKKATINITNLPSGKYFLQVIDSDKTKTKSFIKL